MGNDAYYNQPQEMHEMFRDLETMRLEDAEMSNRMTSIHLPSVGRGYGWAEWGSHSVTEMITLLRAKAERDKAAAEEILAALDEDFLVVTYIGPCAMGNRAIIQAPKPRTVPR